jgi:hypothetical protein
METDNKTEKQRFAYLYTTPSDARIGMYKVGNTENLKKNLATLSRGTWEIGEYSCTVEISDKMTDHQIFDSLASMRIPRQKNSVRYNEWFLFDKNPEKAIEQFREATTNSLQRFKEKSVRICKNRQESGHTMHKEKALNLLIEYNKIPADTTYKELEKLNIGFIVYIKDGRRFNFNINKGRAYCGPVYNTHLHPFPQFDYKDLEHINVEITTRKFKRDCENSQIIDFIDAKKCINNIELF